MAFYRPVGTERRYKVCRATSDLRATVLEWMDDLNPRLRSVRKLGFIKGSNKVL